MWRKPFALLLCFSLFSPFLSAQDILSGDAEIVAKQREIISIAQSLKESDRINALNLQAEREALTTERDDLLKEKESWIATERDMAILKDSLVKQSQSLSREQARNKALVGGCGLLTVVAATLGFYAVTK